MVVEQASLDLRVRRTHKLLWEAFLTELSEQEFDRISVKEICDRAMVHRTTFYKHYEDKYDLLRRGLQQTLELLVAEVEQTGKNASSYTRFFAHVATHERFYRVMLCGKGVGSFQTQLRNCFADLITTEIQHKERTDHFFPVPPSFLAQFYAGALVSALAWWLAQERRPSPEQMGHVMQRLIETTALQGGAR